MERVVCESGLQGWQQRLRDVYESEGEFEQYCSIYGNHIRLGFNSPEEAWDANPLIEGSVEPSDYRVVG